MLHEKLSNKRAFEKKSQATTAHTGAMKLFIFTTQSVDDKIKHHLSWRRVTGTDEMLAVYLHGRTNDKFPSPVQIRTCIDASTIKTDEVQFITLSFSTTDVVS